MNPLTPYLIWIKLGGVALILSVAVAGGCKWQSKIDASNLEAKAHELMVCKMDREALAEALNQVNAHAEQAKRDAAAQASYAVEAVRQADKDRDKYESQLDSVERALETAMRQPVCRAQLEAPLCIALD